MFTGIIEAIGDVLHSEGGKLTLSRPHTFDDIAIGSSICVSGVCLSVTSFDAQTMSFDVIQSTLRASTLGSLSIHDCVNLERAMKASSRYEGHIVQGHAEEVGRVESVSSDTPPTIRISYSNSLSIFIVQHGSITIDGVSLTISALGDCWCEVSIIPHTLSHTTLGTLKSGDSVNLESDIIGRFVAGMMAK